MNVMALAIGGLVGTILRYEMSQWIQPLSHGFPLATLFINLAGSFFLGWFFTIILLYWQVSSEIRLGIGTGFTGSFTTFSTFSLDSVHLISSYPIAGVLYVFSSVAGGIVLSGAGYLLAGLQAKISKRGVV